jgi:1,4-dihydroxy-2-naphthoate octaprenyltransferase
LASHRVSCALANPGVPVSPEPSNKPNLLAGVWSFADPKISLASIASMFLGACAAAAKGPIDVRWLAVTIGGIFAIEAAKNASGEIFDFNSGSDLAIAPQDRSPFSGGKRVLVDGLLTRKQTLVIASLGYLLGILAGLAITRWRETSVLWLGCAGVLCAFFYHAPPLKLSYRGLGELAVAVCYGPFIGLGTYLVQRREIATIPVLVSIPLGLLVANFLWINEFPDFNADAKTGKRTLVVRLGRKRASRVFLVIFAVAFGILFLLPAGGLPITVLFGAVAVIPAGAAAHRVWTAPDNTARLIPAQAYALLSFVLYAIGAGLGLLVAK